MCHCTTERFCQLSSGDSSERVVSVVKGSVRSGGGGSDQTVTANDHSTHQTERFTRTRRLRPTAGRARKRRRPPPSPCFVIGRRQFPVHSNQTNRAIFTAAGGNSVFDSQNKSCSPCTVLMGWVTVFEVHQVGGSQDGGEWNQVGTLRTH